MKNKITKIFVFMFLTFTITSFAQNKTTEKMEWLTTKIEYEGLPLYLRLPKYEDIWKYQSKFPKLINIEHTFDSVKDNGLPTSEYNKSLFDFDNEVVNLLQSESNGVVFLVETYGGSRNYWFFGEDSDFFLKIFDNLKAKYSDKKLELHIQNDVDWDFIKDYPVELYKKK
jgi:hypothetical protein